MVYNEKTHSACLTIHSTDYTDSARYRLEASNRMGRVETAAKLTINGKIEFYLFIAVVIIDDRV